MPPPSCGEKLPQHSSCAYYVMLLKEYSAFASLRFRMCSLIPLSQNRNSPNYQTMRDPAGQDTEGLLPKEHLLGAESTQFTGRTGRTVLKSWKKHSLTITTILGITNTVTLSAFLFLLATRQSHTPCVNQPPKGIAPTLAHLAQEHRPQLLNVTFYPDGTPWREHNSTKADEVWAEYTQAGMSYISILYL